MKRDGSPCGGRRGFTLPELLVALFVGAVVVLGARLMLSGVADAARRIAREAQHADHDANAERLLRSIVANIEAGTAAARPFGGSAHEAHFGSWCDVPGGWQERCAVTLAITGDTSGADANRSLVLSIPADGQLHVRTGFARGKLLYLSDAHEGGLWFEQWGDGLASPLAIGVVIDADTLILSIGERG